jgi:threonine aldolase
MAANGSTAPACGAEFDYASDTVTRPTKEMAEAMLAAMGFQPGNGSLERTDAPLASLVGDDVKGEDAVVGALERRVAELCGKERGLFVASGTMANQLALRCHATILCAETAVPFVRIVADARSHIAEHEFGGTAFHSGCALKTVNVPDGEFLDVERVRAQLFLGNDMHTSPTRVVALENTIGGDVMPVSAVAAVGELCKEKGIALHLDGARLWNAAVASKCGLREFAEHCDTVSLCMSKGLGAPIGSVLVGSARVIDMARQYRKVFGGGWRQAGMLAAAANAALDQHWSDDMARTHDLAKRLWSGLVGLGFTAREPQTNTLWVKVSDGMEVAGGQKATWDVLVPRVNAGSEGGTIRIEGEGIECRLVLHCQITEVGVDLLISRLRTALGK